ncbi:unnamed protein product [Polarella glacialis]|uniref:Uncharacterized protein n=1 Tax=Polarella glacialis TaxID=89957 RepID=A0A813IVA7_POLGL|nr:unnamed protein product [Polarella glacialis]
MATPSVNSGYVPLTEEDVDEAAARTEGGSQSVGSRTFRWNGRQCTGTDLHCAALEGDASAAQLALDSQPGTVKARFTYETVFMGRVQEGSGEAIHRAASRGHVALVKLLMAGGANLSTCVTRSGKTHYDVLHGAMFAEGRGSHLTMIQYLLGAKAEMSKNLDGRFPLHIAYTTGNIPVIRLLRTYLVEAGV